MADLDPNDIEVSISGEVQSAPEAKPAKKAKEKPVEEAAEAPESVETATEATEEPEAEEATESEAETAEGEEGAKPKKRGKSAEQRIDELTKARREAERRAEELELRLQRLEASTKPANETGPVEPSAPNPSDPKYEYGAADPAYEQDYNKYLADLVDYRVEKKIADERKANDAKAATDAQQAKMKADADALNARWNETAEKATEKYPDFKETVIESAKNGEWDLLPLSAAAVQGSEAADDIAYHLATHPDDAKKLADAERGFHGVMNAAIQAGMPAEVAKLMAAPYLMRGQEIFEAIEEKAKGGAPARKQANHTTNAPEPPKERVRGGNGQFTPDFTSDNCDLGELARQIRG